MATTVEKRQTSEEEESGREWALMVRWRSDFDAFSNFIARRLG